MSTKTLGSNEQRARTDVRTTTPPRVDRPRPAPKPRWTLLIVTALVVAIGIGIGALQPWASDDAAVEYTGDPKDAFIGEPGLESSVSTGDAKDAFIGQPGLESSVYTGDPKDAFIGR